MFSLFSTRVGWVQPSWLTQQITRDFDIPITCFLTGVSPRQLQASESCSTRLLLLKEHASIFRVSTSSCRVAYRQATTMSFLSWVLGAFLLVTITATLHYAFCLYRNYLAARKIGVPIRIIPIDHVNPLWLVVDRRVLSALKQLPGWLGNNSFTRYNYRGWEVPDRYFSHRELGDAYVLVSSRNIWLYLSDPDAVTDIARRSKEFDRETSVTGLD